MKAVIKENSIALSAPIKKVEKSYTINLEAHLEDLDQKEEYITKNKQQVIIKLRDEINYTNNQQN